MGRETSGERDTTRLVDTADRERPGVPGRTEAGALQGSGADTSRLLWLQRTHGNRYVRRLFQPQPQFKPRLGPAGDRFEREADRLAGEISYSTADSADSADSAGLRPVTKRPSQGAGQAIDPRIQHLLLQAQAQGRGHPLPAGLRRRYEHGLGTDLAGIRLHTDGRADELNLRFRSSAFTTGHDIFFRRGDYDPASDTGGELLAHELVHAVQQGDGSSPFIQRGKRKNKGGKEPPPKKPKEEEDEEQDPDDALYDEPLEQFVEEPSEEEEESDGPSEIPVIYRDIAAMEDYLDAQGLKREDPKPISVGVVVWNINHLKADDKVDDEDEADVKDADVKDADVMDVEGEAPPSYNTEEITKFMGVLQRRLNQVADRLEATASTLIEELGERKKTAAVRVARREISQLKADIHVIRQLKLDEVLTPGITAMRAQAEDRGTAPISVRANQLQQVRALNRVWQRLRRLRTVLISGKTRSDLKADARDRLRDELTDKDQALIGGAIAGILERLPVADLDKSISALKRETVIDLATRTFLQNKAVNLVLINEMNLGIKHLEATTKKRRLGLSKGPIMLAKGQQVEGGKAGFVTDDADEKTVVGKQYEFYPAVHRTEGDQGLEQLGTFYVSTTGEFAVQGKGVNQAIPWNKRDATFRGIVVHRFSQGGQEFWAGVLHTTPAGKDLNRKKIWPQIEDPLTSLNELAGRFKIPLLIGGDFYIHAEGIVDGLNKEQQKEVEDIALLRHVKASNVARSVFLSAATRGPAVVERLIGAVEAMTTKSKPPPKTPGKAAQGATTKTPTSVDIPELRLIKPGHWQLAHMTGAELKGYWDRYRAAVYLLAGNKTGTLGLAAVKTALAPDDPLGPLWSKTLGGGTLTQLDILRNYRRKDLPDTVNDPEPRITMGRALEKIGYRVVAAGSPTNPKDSGRGENKVQLADLFIANQYWKTTRSGIVAPGTGQLKPMDDPDWSATKTYWQISDHSPVLMLASTDEYAAQPFTAFDLKPVAEQEAMEANRRIWEGFKEKLAGLHTAGFTNISLSKSRKTEGQTAAELETPKTVDEVIGEILKLLTPLPTGPTMVVEEVRVLARQLAQDVRFANPMKITPEIDAVLKYLSEWDHPFYPVDFSDKSLTSDLAATEIPATEIPAPEIPAPEIPGGGPEPPFPTGRIEHGWQTCYLAALIHVFASHENLTGLLSAQHPIPDARHAGVQKSLRDLVTLLRDPAAMIKRGTVESFVLELDKLGGILARRALSETSSKASKSKPSSMKKEAAKTAQHAFATGTAYGLQQDASEILTHLLDLVGPPDPMWIKTQSILAEPGADVGTATDEKHLTLSLGLGTKKHKVKSVSQALRLFTDVEVIESTGQQKQYLFTSLPEVLTLVLNRFGSAVGQTSKVEWAVTPDDPLVIPDEWLSDSFQGPPPTYRLRHVVHHAGTSAHSGHYTSLGKFTGTEQWYRHDDTDPAYRRRLVGRPAALDTGYIYVYVKQ